MYLSFHIFEISTGSTNVSTDSGRKGYLIDVTCSLLTVLLGFANTLNRRKEAKRNVTRILLGKLDFGIWDRSKIPVLQPLTPGFANFQCTYTVPKPIGYRAAL